MLSAGVHVSVWVMIKTVEDLPFGTSLPQMGATIDEEVMILTTKDDADKWRIPYTDKFRMIIVDIHGPIDHAETMSALVKMLKDAGMNAFHVKNDPNEQLFVPYGKSDQAMLMLADWAKAKCVEQLAKKRDEEEKRRKEAEDKKNN